MKPLVDADVLRYEVGFAAEAGWQSDGVPPFDYVSQILDERISNICATVEATEKPTLYLTGKGNFRYEIAKRQPYKDRPSVKPYHFKNITAYMHCVYDVIVSTGMEADDLMAIEQTRRIEEGGIQSVICTRDKDLRQVPGIFYSWELGNQPSFGPYLVDETGWIKLDSKTVINKNGKAVTTNKIVGVGGMFFYAQCLMGDRVDSIPGIDKMGPAKAFKLLAPAETLMDAHKAVLGAYRTVYGDNAEVELLEQGRLLYMTRKLNEDGTVVLWELPK